MRYFYNTMGFEYIGTLETKQIQITRSLKKKLHDQINKAVTKENIVPVICKEWTNIKVDHDIQEHDTTTVISKCQKSNELKTTQEQEINTITHCKRGSCIKQMDPIVMGILIKSPVKKPSTTRCLIANVLKKTKQFNNKTKFNYAYGIYY